MTAEFWGWAPTPVPVSNIAQFAHDLESQGWDGLAIGEAHGLLPDPYTALAAAVTSTTRLQLGTAVSVTHFALPCSPPAPWSPCNPSPTIGSASASAEGAAERHPRPSGRSP